MRAETYLPGDRRRAELGDFLRRRRAELSTDLVGLPATRRRRTPGLRREEVAELANISTALYSWLEQGRDVPVSRRTVDAVASALQVAPSEREHLRALITPQISEFREEVSPQLERMIGALRAQPAFVVNHKWDVVLMSRCAHLVFKHANDDTLVRLNLLESIFKPERREVFLNWREVAQKIVELYRYDYGLYADDVETVSLVEKLRGSDSEFAQMWDAHRVRRDLGPDAICRVNHPLLGEIALEPSMFSVVESPGLRCMIFTPSDGESALRVEQLVAECCAELDNPALGATISLR